MTRKTNSNSLTPLVGGENPTTSTAVHPHLNEQQLAERWGISIKKLQADRVKGGGIPFIRIGRAVRYRYADVLAWEERHLRTNTSEKPEGIGTLSSEQWPVRAARHQTGRSCPIEWCRSCG